MNASEIQARLQAIEARLGDGSYASAVISARRFAVYAHRERGADVFAGQGADIAALLDQADEAVAAADPAVLAKTLGVAA